MANLKFKLGFSNDVVSGEIAWLYGSLSIVTASAGSIASETITAMSEIYGDGATVCQLDAGDETAANGLTFELIGQLANQSVQTPAFDAGGVISSSYQLQAAAGGSYTSATTAAAPAETVFTFTNGASGLAPQAGVFLVDGGSGFTGATGMTNWTGIVTGGAASSAMTLRWNNSGSGIASALSQGTGGGTGYWDASQLAITPAPVGTPGVSSPTTYQIGNVEVTASDDVSILEVRTVYFGSGFTETGTNGYVAFEDNTGGTWNVNFTDGVMDSQATIQAAMTAGGAATTCTGATANSITYQWAVPTTSANVTIATTVNFPWDGTVTAVFTDGVDQQDTLVATGTTGTLTLTTDAGVASAVASDGNSSTISTAATGSGATGFTIGAATVTNGTPGAPNTYTYLITHNNGTGGVPASTWSCAFALSSPITVTPSVVQAGSYVAPSGGVPHSRLQARM